MKPTGAKAWRTREKLTARQRRWHELLESVEPGLQLAELAALLKQPYATVQRWAAFFAYPIRDARRERAARVDWRNVDWRKANVQIAAELGMSRERVRQVRAAAGAAPAEPPAQRFYVFVVAHCEQMRGQPVRAVIKASGVAVCYEVARQALRRAGIGPFKRADGSARLDWRLPNRDLARIHHRTIQQIANLRFRTSAGPAKWDLRGGRALKDAAYRAALEKETRRAALEKARRFNEGGSAQNGQARQTSRPSSRT